MEVLRSVKNPTTSFTTSPLSRSKEDIILEYEKYTEPDITTFLPSASIKRSEFKTVPPSTPTNILTPHSFRDLMASAFTTTSTPAKNINGDLTCLKASI